MKQMLFSFGYALRGLAAGIQKTRNLRVHLAAAAYCFALAPFFVHSRGGWVALIVLCFVIFAAELFNTAIETLCDRITTDFDRQIGLIKDLAAGAVFILALGAVIVAGILFSDGAGWRRLLQFCQTQPWYPELLAAALPAAILFIRGRINKNPVT